MHFEDSFRCLDQWFDIVEMFYISKHIRIGTLCVHDLLCSYVQIDGFTSKVL